MKSHDTQPCIALYQSTLMLAELLVEHGFVFTDLAWESANRTEIDLVICDQVNLPAVRQWAGEFRMSLPVLVMGGDEADSKYFALDPHVSEAELLRTVHLMLRIGRLERQLLLHQGEVRSMRNLALTDPLTGLWNRRAWDEELQVRLQQPNSLCVALMDLDFFKAVNDGQGHLAGDQVLREAAESMRQSLRSGDFLARLGGDEFGLLVSNLNADDAQGIVDRLRKKASHFLADSSWADITLSAGFVYYAEPVTCLADALYQEASLSLLQAKRRSRNCTVGTIGSA
ncbi:MAG: GGDEF domain-containing protein [Planctomycetales bacterium]|nr:GGDEF domain-containing protein [Planctomycetales bacterium]